MRRWGFSLCGFALLAHAWDIHVDHMPLRYLLQTLADVNHQNIVLSDRVNGKIDLHLEKVAWQPFWRFLMNTQALQVQNSENILWVDKIYTFPNGDKKYPSSPQLELVGIELKHIDIQRLQSLFKPGQANLLSPLGKMIFEPHTNRVWINDLPVYIEQTKRLIQSLDVLEAQVVIDARIVSINRNYVKDLGVRLGLTQGGVISGELAGLHSQKPQELSPFQDLAALPLQANPIHLALSLAKMGQQYLDAELSWLEGKGGAKIIARPHLMTQNQTEASIASGEDIPYQETSLNGATSVSFKKALLLLKVKPHILPHGQMILDLQISQDADSGQRVQGVPIISTKTISTSVRLHSGETLVLGGIEKKDSHHERVGWPLLKDIPGVDLLFSKQEKRYLQEELLLFITPVLT